MRTIDELTVGEARALAALFGWNAPAVQGLEIREAQSAWRLGANYLIRTVTMIDTGRLVEVTEHELVLEDAAWIADTGRFMDAVAKAEFGEVEPFPKGRVILGRGAVIDAAEITKLPVSQK